MTGTVGREPGIALEAPRGDCGAEQADAGVADRQRRLPLPNLQMMFEVNGRRSPSSRRDGTDGRRITILIPCRVRLLDSRIARSTKEPA